MSSEIRPCKCKNDYQDKAYGKDMRVWNKTSKGFRCACCATEVTVGTVKK